MEVLLLNIAIFRKLHVNEPIRSKLANAVPHDVAERWLRWVPLAPLDPYYKPVGYMIKVLLNDPQAEPPDLDKLIQAEQEKNAPRRASIVGKFAPTQEENAEDDE